MRILALDPGTHFGWAVTPHESGTWDFSRRRHEGGGFIFLRFRNQLLSILDTGIKCVYYEEVRRHLGTDAAHLYGGFIAVLTEECERKGIPYTGVGVGTIKRHATGRGNATKEDMVTAAEARGWKVEDDNHADALFLLDYAKTELERGETAAETKKPKKRRVKQA